LSTGPSWKMLCEYGGLSEYEARVYVSLIEAGAMKASKISAMCGVPRTKIYSVLEKLIDMDLVVKIPGDPRKFAPKPPRDAFETYLSSYQSKARNLLLTVSSLEKTFEETTIDMPKRAELWVMQKRDEILEKIHELLAKAKSMITIVTNEEGSILLYKYFSRLFGELKEQSVKIRFLVPSGSSNRFVLNELRYTCTVQHLDISLPIIFLDVDRSRFILASLKINDYSTSSGMDRAILSDDQDLRNMMFSILCDRKIETLTSRRTGA